MSQSTLRSVRFALLAGFFALPALANAQYNCPVTIDLSKKTVLKAEIVDEERPSTEELWKLLKTIGFERAKGADIADPSKTEKTTLKGDIGVDIAGAGRVTVSELNLVRNRYNRDSWVIAPEDVARLLTMKRGPNR